MKRVASRCVLVIGALVLVAAASTAAPKNYVYTGKLLIGP